MRNVKLEEIPHLLRGPLFEYARTQLRRRGVRRLVRAPGDRAARGTPRAGGGAARERNRPRERDRRGHPRLDVPALRRVALVASFQAESMVLIDLACRIVAGAGGAHAGHRAPPRGDARLHRVGAGALPDTAAHPRAGREGAGGDDRRARRHAVPAVGGVAQRVLRGAQGEPAGAGAAGLRRMDHRVAPGADADPRGDPGGGQRPRPRGHHQGGAAGGLDHGRRCGTTCADARDPPSPAVRPRLHVDRLRAVHAGDASPGSRSAPAAGGGRANSDKECLLHPPIEIAGVPEPAAVPARGAV